MTASTGRRRILVGVGGGIAAYKVCSVIRHFTEAGDDVHVVPTRSALNFVGAATFEALSGNPAYPVALGSCARTRALKVAVPTSKEAVAAYWVPL